MLGRLADTGRYINCPGYIVLNRSDFTIGLNDNFIACVASGALGDCDPPVIVVSERASVPDFDEDDTMGSVTSRELCQLYNAGCTVIFADEFGPGYVDCGGSSDADGTSLCSNTCAFANDGDCDDGGPGSDFSLCGFGTDCADCGPRTFSGGDEPSGPGSRIWLVTNYGGAPGGYIYVGDGDDDQNPPLLSSFAGGGIDPDLRAELSAVTDVFDSSAAAVDSVCSRIGEFFRPPLANFILQTTFDGVVVSISTVFLTRCEA